MMLLRDFVIQLTTQSPHLSATLTVSDFVNFASLAARVQHIAANHLGLTATRNSLVMPFLEAALSPEYPAELMPDLWRLSSPHLSDCQMDPADVIREFGLKHELTDKFKLPERFLRALISNCTVCWQSSTLHIHSRVNGYLYNIDGPHAIQTVILHCSNEACGTSYRPSYYTRDNMQIYYSETMGHNPDFLHIHCHYYMTRRLSLMFRVLQMLAHVSHFNLVNWYNELFVDEKRVSTFVLNQKFSPSMSEEMCRDGLILHSLMNHADRRGTHLAVSSSGNDTIRFDSAIEHHLELLLVEGTRYRDHFCSTCVQLTSDGVDPETDEPVYRGRSL
ncbi:uncharacterized protein MELLADRAFT_87913 [Melampsora larici-populina 98AG31]|uniref:CxC5 like cysteine cluster associated with KDZ domain-containing protein n=1 Tax=Melampsora larici-populina (strain 98AG31 / pathotype 3-4-7) TaxID=747676 RepID=F4RPZ4_MELLP|nr:uncharacterized protein MELLADRAFT_87913 [Melampsora larici-populina 98AG31]EGG05647.1 hypothetical protein MELLADRAFT_87913 [Melampsora larici-populina 98AG31]